MAKQAEVHVGDTTEYRLRIWDDEVPFDPTPAAIRRIIFRLPNGTRVEREADEILTVPGPPTSWQLVYRAKPADNLHVVPGSMRLQVYLEWLDGSQFSSNVRTSDQFGRELRVHPNL